MIEKIMKAVKSSNKRRGRNITIGTVIGFLLSCTVVMGAVDGNYLFIKDDSGIKFSTDGNAWGNTNPYEDVGNTWNQNTYINNTILSVNGISGNAYGVKLELNSPNFKFINNGSIVVIGDTYNNGIYNTGTIGDIINTGIISVSSSSGSVNGINNYKNTIGDIINTGVIIANSSRYESNGIYQYGGILRDITNTGIINAGGSNTNGYGIYNQREGTGDMQESIMGNITNTGIITSYITPSQYNIGYGIANTGIMGNITNIGIISGSSQHHGYGIYNVGTIRDITNTGIINASSNGGGIYNGNNTIENIINTGIINGSDNHHNYYSFGRYGIYNNSYERNVIKAITNTGVINGSVNAIKNNKDRNGNIGTIATANNYGILANSSNNEVVDGLDIVDSPTTDTNKIVNYGLIIKNKGINEADITAGAGGNHDILFYDTDKNIIGKRNVTIENVVGKNENKDNSFTGNKENHILNAFKNTYKVTGSNNEITGSIINAYGTAVVFEGADKELTLAGTIVNGGLDNSATILGSNEGDTLILQSGKIKYIDNEVEKSVTQNTIVNGSIDMGEGDDILAIGDGTIINGTLNGGIGNNTLNLGISSVTKSNPAESQGINIMHNISNFKDININTNVTLFERTVNTSGKGGELTVTGTEKITIEENGALTLRIDGTNGNSHALSSNIGGTIESNGGKLLLALNGVSDGSEINIGMKLGDGLYGVENTDIEYRDLFTLETTSLLHSVSKNGADSTKVTVTSKSTLPLSSDAPEDVNYEKLNKIYQSMRVVDGVKEFNVDKGEKLSIFLGYLNDIYAGNPYSYSSELSRKSMGMFRDIATENQFKPELNKWLIMGGLTHVDGGTKDTYYGKGYYTYDIGSSDMDADTKITGAYMLGEYGASDTLTYGVVIGGNKLKSNLSNGSKVDGDALYMGAYAKKYVGNLKLTGGLGLQYGDYDADRFAAGKGITETRSYSDNYNDMTYDIYLNGRYSHNIGENLFLEPYGTLSYTYIKQDSADEGSKVLAIETDSKSFGYTAAKVGVDIKKVIPHEKGKSTLSAGVSYTRLLTGADEENITGRFKGENATDFDILVAHKNEQSIGLNAKYALELESGILFDVKGSYSLEKDSHNGTGKNRNKGEWIVGAGIGYKF